MGPYCKFCDRRCFVHRVLADGSGTLMATCPDGMRYDRNLHGQTHATAYNPSNPYLSVIRTNEWFVSTLARRIRAERDNWSGDMSVDGRLARHAEILGLWETADILGLRGRINDRIAVMDFSGEKVA